MTPLLPQQQQGVPIGEVVTLIGHIVVEHGKDATGQPIAQIIITTLNGRRYAYPMGWETTAIVRKMLDRAPVATHDNGSGADLGML